jgi:Cu+-exporting ATPase
LKLPKKGEVDEISDNFSVDDILKEIDGKKSEPDVPTPKKPPFSEEAESLTAEINQIEKQRGISGPISDKSAKPDLSVTQILGEAAAKSDNPKSDLSVTQILNEPAKPAKPLEIKRFTPSERSVERKKKRTDTTDFDTREVVNREAEKQAASVPSAEITSVVNEEKKLEDITEDIVPVEKPGKPTYLLPEEKERLNKLREEELLEKELALEDPDELLDGINPYDVKNIETPETSEINAIKLTRDVEPTESLTPNETLLKTLDTLETPVISTPPVKTAKQLDSDGVKEFTPNADKTKKKQKEPKSKHKKDYKEELDNSSLLETLNSNLAKKRKADIDIRRTLNVDTLSSVGSFAGKGKALPAKLNIDYKKQIIEDSAILPSTSDLIHSKQLEERELGKKRKRKIRDFILEDIEDSDDDFVYEEEDDDGDFDGYDSSDAIRGDLDESHKGLKWRLALLFFIAAALVFFAFVHDFGQGNEGLRRVITNRLFGDVDKTADYAKMYVFANLIAGVLAMVVCSGVIIRGIKNLFLGRADCDSACAVPIVVTTVTSIVHITANGSTALIEQNLVHVYVPVAVVGLMLNTLGKIFMIVRAKKNFEFISGDSTKYSAYMPNTNEDGEARAFTKGILDAMPVPVFLRKTEFLADYLKNSYCTDWADLICRKLVPVAAIATIVMGITAFFLPFGEAALIRDIRWAFTAASAFSAVLAPFSIMFLVNAPLLKAAKSLAKSDCVVMGYTAAQKFSKANAIVIDAGILFPAGSVKFLNVKRCQKPNAINSISIDESIIIAASLAIKGNSIMSSMFYDMIAGDSDLLHKIESCIYEVNMGINGWMGNKRVMLGNREQMKHHGVDVPAENKERRHCPDNGDVVYLAVGSETVAMFFIEVVPNSAVKHGLWELDANGVALAVKSRDSLVTVAKLADIFELNPERVRVLSYDQHSGFDDYSKYTSRGSSEIACNGTFTSFARALTTAKMLIRDMMVTSATLFVSVFVAGFLGILFVIFSATSVMSASTIFIYNMIWLGIMLVLQALRRY